MQQTNRNRSWKVFALLPLIALLAAACGGDDNSSKNEGASGEGKLAKYDLSGIDITVGSKDFTEQLVLGEIIVQAFEAAGANVTNKVNLGGTDVNRSALLSGDIDAYAEYNGTGWLVHLGNDNQISDSDELTSKVREADLEENKIRWLGQSPFNNTYGFAVNADYVKANGEPTLDDMAEYIKANPDSKVCMESEFPDRPDGLVLFENATGFTIPDDQKSIIDTNLIYTETASGSCTFGEIFTTDGRIPALELTIVDDQGAFVIYNVSITMRDEVYQKNPKAFDEIADLVLSNIDNDKAQELNAKVGAEGEDQKDVAKEFLKDQGLI